MQPPRPQYRINQVQHVVGPSVTIREVGPEGGEPGHSPLLHLRLPDCTLHDCARMSCSVLLGKRSRKWRGQVLVMYPSHASHQSERVFPR